jgi:tRNA pseudouridine55 synthase
LFGLLNIYKPRGLTSRQAVDRVERFVRPFKAGHAGTLDPLATGVLVICVGRATRLIEYVQRLPKRYRATFLLGQSSPTDDIEREATPLSDAPVPTADQVRAAAATFIGAILQRPPDFSAVHVAGQRAYRLARRGKPVELAPRPVEIHAIELLRYDYPELELDISCGSGTYIRALGRDLAAALSTVAVMSALERTAIGPLTIDTACALDRLHAESIAVWLRSPREVLAEFPTLELTDDEARRIWQGQSIHKSVRATDTQWVALDTQGELAAILRRRDDGSLSAYRGFPPET